MRYNKNESLFFDVMKNGQIFPSKVCYFQYDSRFLFCREMGNIRSYKELRLQKLIKSRFSGLKNLLGRVSPSHFLKIVLAETSNIWLKNF